MKLGQLLLQDDVINQEQLETALRAQQRQGGKLGEHLVRQQAIDQERLHFYLGRQHTQRLEERRRFGRLGLIKRLFSHFYRLSPFTVLVSIALLMLGTTLNMTFPYFVKFTFDYLIDTNSFLPIFSVGLLMVLIQIAGQVAYYLGCQQFNIANIRFSNNLRHELYKRLAFLHYTSLTQRDSADWLNHITTDVDNVIDRWEHTFITFFRNLFAITISCTILLLVDPLLTFLVLALSLAIVSLPGRVSNMANTPLGRRPMMITDILGLLKEKVYAFKTIKTFNAQQVTMAEFGRRFDAYYRNDFFMVRFWNIAFDLRVWMGAVLSGLILYIGGLRVINGGYSLGDLMMVIITVNILSPFIDNFMQLLIRVNDVKRYWQRCCDVLDINIDPQAGAAVANPALQTGVSGALSFHELSFEYGRSKIFDRLNIQFAPRRTYAVFGRSGSGKSTLLKLILKQIQAQSGRITLDDQALDNLDAYNVCRLISYVSQKPAIFSDSAEENIKIGGLMFFEEISKAQIEAAARAAGIHERIVNLPQGYQTPIGDGGQQLSGGEMQRISIARALLKNPLICLFDEPTSALDPDNEKLVMQTIAELRGRCTILIATHNPDFIDLVDEVLVLDGKQTAFHPADSLDRAKLTAMLDGVAESARNEAGLLVDGG